MSYRIAIASSDGIVVNQHFGRAQKFLIAQAEEDASYCVVQILEVTPICQGGNHDEERLEKLVQELSECDYVLVSKIGMKAELVLEQHGIGVYELPGMIEDSVRKIVTHIQVENLFSDLYYNSSL